MRDSALFAPPTPSNSTPRPAAGASSFVPLSEVASLSAPLRSGGIARLAAGAAVVDSRREVEYRDLPCRTLISRCDSPRVPFEFQINPYRGCAVACTYCYARYTHEFMELEDWREFGRKNFLKPGAREALLPDLPRRCLRRQQICN